MTMASSDLIIVTGMTGAGRSTAAKALEDLGWFVIDNLPPQMLQSVVQLINDEDDDGARIAVVVDVRSRGFFAQLRGALDQMAEREMVRDLRGDADVLIDTSNLNVHQLASRVEAAFADTIHPVVRATVVSFGFKYGIPVDADMVFDMRFLPNPHWDPELRPLTGLDEPVSDFVLKQPAATDFLDRVESLLETVYAGFLRERKQYLSIAVGCTGGKHRSVAMAHELGRRLRERGVQTSVVHRDMGRE
jgi:RNase adapter protein RapZ